MNGLSSPKGNVALDKKELDKKDKKEMIAPLVSVIVPVYNTKMYLQQCFESLRTQTLKDIEIIIIDDGSTDGSGAICDEFSVMDPRVRVQHKSNEGLAAARNDGISLSRAEFIMYVDSDDWVEPDFCEKPYQLAIENEADIVCFQYFRFDQDGITKKLAFPVEGLVKNTDVLTKYWSYTYATSMNKLYRKNLFTGINYPKGRYSEDIAVAYKLIYAAKRVFFLNEWLYHYRTDRVGSICNSGSLKHRTDHMYCTYIMLEDMKAWGLIEEKEETIFAMWYLMTLGRDAELSEKCDNILMRSKLGNLSWKKKIMLIIYRFSPEFFDIIARISGVRFKERATSG